MQIAPTLGSLEVQGKDVFWLLPLLIEVEAFRVCLRHIPNGSKYLILKLLPGSIKAAKGNVDSRFNNMSVTVILGVAVEPTLKIFLKGRVSSGLRFWQSGLLHAIGLSCKAQAPSPNASTSHKQSKQSVTTLKP